MKMRRRNFLGKFVGVGLGAILAGCTSLGQAGDAVDAENASHLTFEVLADGLDFPEGPAFDRRGNLWCTEMNAGNLIRWQGGEVKRIATGGRPNGLAFDHRGRAWVCDSGQNAIRRYTPEDNSWETILDRVQGERLQTPNDLCFDPAGSLLFSCPNFNSEEAKGYVVCLSPSGGAVKIAEGLYRPNGLEFVDKGKSLVVADTLQKTLIKGAWDTIRREWKTPSMWCTVGGKEGPDGMAYGANGLLYQAIYGDGVLRVVENSGAIRYEVSVGGLNPTNVAMDPTGEMGLVVTETEKGCLIHFPTIRPKAAIFDGDAWN